MRRVYLDNNATTAVSPQVRRVMVDVLRAHNGNPSSRYRDGLDAASIMESSRRAVAEAVGALPDELIFTGSASEANNQILLSCVANATGDRRTIVASPIEHPSVLSTLKRLESTGTPVRYCPVDRYGQVTLDALEPLVDDTTLLVSVGLANNEIGVIQDIPAIADVAHRSGAWMMSDCVQALGKIPVDLKTLDVDYASFSAHKIHGPKGAGVAYVRTGLPVASLIHGGHQENSLRAGTESLHNIAGFGEACRHVPEMLTDAPRVAALRDVLVEGIVSMLPAAQLNSTTGASTLCNTISVSLPGFDAAEAIGFLDYNGVAVSAGSACNAKSKQPSEVLKAIGLTDELAGQTLRLTLGGDTTRADIDYTLKCLKRYLDGGPQPVTPMSASSLRDMLADGDVVVVDIRRPSERKMIASAPGALETSKAALHKGLDLPRDKQIVVVCQVGFDAAIAAYALRSQGYRRVSYLNGGAVAWAAIRGDW